MPIAQCFLEKGASGISVGQPVNHTKPSQPAKDQSELLREFVSGKSYQIEANSGNDPWGKKKGSSGFGARAQEMSGRVRQGIR